MFHAHLAIETAITPADNQRVRALGNAQHNTEERRPNALGVTADDAAKFGFATITHGALA